MLRVGLTGGIGCGKTTVARYFSDLGVPVLDADEAAREVVEPGKPALLAIVKAFGDKVLHKDGSLNRAALREKVFNNAEQKQKLEAITHPLIFQSLEHKASALQAPYCIMAIPLLFETRSESFVDRILVVDCPESVQIERVQKRDGLSLSLIDSILSSQVSRAYRRSHAHDLIDNSRADSTLAEQVKKLHNSYLLISGKPGQVCL